MRNLWRSVLGLWVIGMGLAVSALAQAATANGPYYATPSWDQKLAASTRFVVLLDWNSDAVLDRETGLVWEKSPAATVRDWNIARFQCTSRTTGGRKGWRLPSVHELASLFDPSSNSPALPAGHPFVGVVTFDHYWSATTSADNPANAWAVSSDGQPTAGSKFTVIPVWCVRGGMSHGDAY